MHFNTPGDNKNLLDVEEIKQIVVQIKTLKEKLKNLDAKAEESSRYQNFFEEPPNRDVSSEKCLKSHKKDKGQGDAPNKNFDNGEKLNIFLATLLELKDLAEELHKKFSEACLMKSNFKNAHQQQKEDAFSAAVDNLLHQINSTYKLLVECSGDNKKIISRVEQIDKNVSNLSSVICSTSLNFGQIGGDGAKNKQTRHKLKKSGGSKILNKIREENFTENHEMPDSKKLPRPPSNWFSFANEKSKKLDFLTIIYEPVLPKCKKCKKKSDGVCPTPVLSKSTISLSTKSDKKCKKCTRSKSTCKNCAKLKGTSEILIPKKMINNSVEWGIENSPSQSTCRTNASKCEKCGKKKCNKCSRIAGSTPKQPEKPPKKKFSCFGLFTK